MGTWNISFETFFGEKYNLVCKRFIVMLFTSLWQSRVCGDLLAPKCPKRCMSSWFYICCLLIIFVHSPQMRLKLHPAPELQIPGASADRVPSVFQIRPVKSANAVQSECRLIYSCFHFHSARRRDKDNRRAFFHQSKLACAATVYITDWLQPGLLGSFV